MAKSSRPSEDPKKRKPSDDRSAKRRARDREEDDEDDDEEEEEEEVQIRPKKIKRPKVRPSSVVGTVIGGIVGFVAFVYFLYWVYSPVGADNRLLCYCPPETFSIEGMDVEEVIRNTKLKEVWERSFSRYKTNGNDRRFKDSGLTEKDVAYYLNCQATGDWEREKDLTPQERRGSLSMLRFKNSFDPEKIIGSFTNSTPYRKEEFTGKNGNKYYQLSTVGSKGEMIPDVSFYIPNSRTLIIGTTRKEVEEATGRVAGKIELDETMRGMVDNTDGHYFRVAKTLTLYNSALEMFSGPSMMTAGFMDEQLQDVEKRKSIVIGNASWWASDGNYFLFADGSYFLDREQASRIYGGTYKTLLEMKTRFYREDAKVGDKEDMFFVPEAKTNSGMSGSSGGKSEDLREALTDYFKSSHVNRRGNLVYVEGRVGHEKFNKLWNTISSKMFPQPVGGNRGGPMGPGGMMPFPGR